MTVILRGLATSNEGDEHWPKYFPPGQWGRIYYL